MRVTDWLTLHLAATAFMTGVISICHWVHYPLMRLADPVQFSHFSHQHQRRISWIVLPCMLVELTSALWIVAFNSQQQTLGAVGLALLILIWLSTALVQSRQHLGLRDGYEAKRLDQLLRWNRPRLLLWWTRLAVAFLLVRAQTP